MANIAVSSGIAPLANRMPTVTATSATEMVASSSSAAALELLATISVALVAVTVGIRLANGAMPLDTAMLAILLAPEAYWPIRRVGAEFHAAADGAVALDDVLEELTPAVPTITLTTITLTT